jgi:hypothetical protein
MISKGKMFTCRNLQTAEKYSKQKHPLDNQDELFSTVLMGLGMLMFISQTSSFKIHNISTSCEM